MSYSNEVNGNRMNERMSIMMTRFVYQIVYVSSVEYSTAHIAQPMQCGTIQTIQLLIHNSFAMTKIAYNQSKGNTLTFVHMFTHGTRANHLDTHTFHALYFIRIEYACLLVVVSDTCDKLSTREQHVQCSILCSKYKIYFTFSKTEFLYFDDVSK